MSKLNAEQKAVYDAHDCNKLVEAGPGTGKTTMLCECIKYVVEHSDKEVFVVTFTRAGAQAICDKLGEMKGVHVGTFHGLALRVMMDEGVDDDFVLHVDEYQTRALELFKAGRWKDRIGYIFVDEFQDCNQDQYELLQHLYGPGKVITAIGDDNQSIYGWRGGRSDLMLSFVKDFPDVKVMALKINYRSSSQIVDLVNECRPKGLFDKPDLRAAKGRGFMQPCVMNEKGGFQDVQLVATRIQGSLRAKYKPSQVCALARTRPLLHALETALIRLGIRCTVIEGTDMVPRNDRVVLSTIHGVKGLEWESVHVLGLNNSYFPSRVDSDSPERMLEERNLFFVAVSRAKQELYIWNSAANPSEFVTGLKTVKQCGRVSSFIKPPPPSRPHDWVAVTNLIKALGGSNVASVRAILGEQLIKSLASAGEQEESVHHQYPPWISSEGLHQEFGIFLEALERRMLAEKTRDKSLLKNRFADTHSKWIKVHSAWNLSFVNWYKRYQDLSLSWRDLLVDTWQVAMSVRVASNRQFVSYLKVTHEALERGMPIYEGMQRRLASADYKKVMASASVKYEYKSKTVKGEVDLVLDDCVVDVKTSSSSDRSSEHFLQLLLYASMLRLSGLSPAKSLAVYNPMKDSWVTLDISSWHNHRALLDFFCTL